MDKIIALCVLTHMGKIIENTKVSNSLGKCLGFMSISQKPDFTIYSLKWLL